ncbi:tetratricopeptide repeat protein [Simiduia curdlanivorans]|uniref:Tetratricopeptide repeat protein n=1 Tax=Simiduia curdlanivorans TaxID=1492769 RepID=A0ABV8V6M4_9GAMM|nr:tetratricopeptide repeat protein [Simiduia curdlanivorans]MDN3638398.1 tetratricopeptide repeat protein [Simiduia curdlanivorans]
MTFNTRLFIVAILFAALAGCASFDGPPAAVDAEQESVELSAELVEPEAVAPIERAFEPDTFYALLVAEMAGSRERFDIALGNYVQQAHKTRDPGVIARATRIARFLENRSAALEMSVLWVEVEPTNNEARVLAASELSEAGRLSEAFTHADYLAAQGNPMLLQTVAAYASKGTDIEREQLIEGLEALKPQYPEAVELWMALALAYQQQGLMDEATGAVKKAVKLDPEHFQAQALQARIRFQQGDQVGAIRQMAALVDTNPDDNRIRLQYARMLAGTDMVKAADQFEVLVQDNPHDADLLLSLALIRFEQKNFEQAQPLFEQLTDIESRRSTAYYYLARIAQQQGDFNDALNNYLKVELGPDFMPALVQTLEILVAAGELKPANARMQAVRKTVPQQVERLFALEAEVYGKYDHLDAAEQILSQGLAEVPDSTRLLFSRAMINERRNMLDLAELDFRKVIRYEPNNAMALNALGYTLADRTERYDEAYELIVQAHSLKPDDAAIIDSLGWVSYRMGNYTEALLRLQEAFSLFPDPEIAAHLGEVLWVTGDRAAALKVWREGVELNPSSELIPKVMKRLGAPE